LDGIDTKEKTMKYLLAFLLLVSPAFAADPGFYVAGDGVFMGTGTGFGTEADIFRDLGLDVFELSTLDMPGWYVWNTTLSATVTDRWAGGFSYQNDPILPDLLVVGIDNAWAAYCLRGARQDPCPVGTAEMVGTWSTDDLGGGRIDHLSVFKARREVSTTCTIPEPTTLAVVIIAIVLILAAYLLSECRK
jgi:hypothetical protein